MKLPRWDCRNNALLKRQLEEWTLAELDKLDNELMDRMTELVTERDIRDMEAMQSDEFFKWSEEQFRREPLRARVVQAVKAAKAAKAAKSKDKAAKAAKAAEAKDRIKRLTGNDPELLQLAIGEFTRGQGRPKGSKKTDIKVKKRELLEYAAIDVERIHYIWQNTIWEDKRGHRNRTQTPTAVEIAARRWGFGVGELRKFRKNFASFIIAKRRYLPPPVSA
jgi:hypothetical protein